MYCRKIRKNILHLYFTDEMVNQSFFLWQRLLVIMHVYIGRLITHLIATPTTLSKSSATSKQRNNPRKKSIKTKSKKLAYEKCKA